MVSNTGLAAEIAFEVSIPGLSEKDAVLIRFWSSFSKVTYWDLNPGVSTFAMLFSVTFRELLEKKYKEKLGRLPFREKKQIALYGAGKHTDCLLWLYQYLIGVIVSEIDLIVSTTKVTNPNNAYVVRCLDEITDQWDIYILSSGVYQEEMYQNLRAKSIPEEKIYRLYDKNDAVDCVMVYEALFS